MEKNIRDKDSGLCTVKMLSTTNVIQVALICSRAEQKLLLQSLLHLGRLCWLSSLFCFHTPQKSVGVGLRTLKGDVQRCCFSSAHILISCLSHCPALMWGRGDWSRKGSERHRKTMFLAGFQGKPCTVGWCMSSTAVTPEIAPHPQVVHSRWPRAVLCMSKGRTVPPPHIWKQHKNPRPLYSLVWACMVVSMKQCFTHCQTAAPFYTQQRQVENTAMACTCNPYIVSLTPWVYLVFSRTRKSSSPREVESWSISQDISTCCQHISKSEWSSKKALKVMRLQPQFLSLKEALSVCSHLRSEATAFSTPF